MKYSKYKHFPLTIWLTFFFLAWSSYASTNCDAMDGYKKFQCQQIKYCPKYKPESISYETEIYPDMADKSYLESLGWLTESTDPLVLGASIYRENQNNIYACSIIQVQRNSYSLIAEKLLPIDNTWEIKSQIQKKLDIKLKKLDLLAKNKTCKNTDPDSTYRKKELLKESTYELCKYRFYLEYVASFHNNLGNLQAVEMNPDNKEPYSRSLSYLTQRLITKKQDIAKETQHSYRVFENAFRSYVYYESNVGPHILLELVKEDLIAYRKNLYKTLSPINQVMYKVRNAMSID